MGKIKDFTDLDVYNFSLDLVKEGYEFIKILPKEERFNLAYQLRKSLNSVPANIAEGFGRYNYQENIQFCRLARGSLYETKSHVIVASRIYNIPEKIGGSILKAITRTAKILNGYIRSLRKYKRITSDQ